MTPERTAATLPPARNATQFGPPAMPNHVVDVEDFAGAIEQYEDRASELFNEAQESLYLNRADKDAQGKLSAAMSQLQTAETMRSAQLGRDGYAQVVALMVTTATHAETIAAKLAAVADSLVLVASGTNATTYAEKREMITLLTGALQAVSQVSPATVWQKPTDGA